MVDVAPPHMGPAHAVRLHDALGLARGTGGIDDVERRLGAQLNALGHLAGRCQPRLQRQARAGAVQRNPDGRTGCGVRRAHGLGGIGIGKKEASFGVTLHAGETLRGRTRGQRRHHHPGPQRAQKHGGVVDRTASANGNRLAGAHTIALQRTGNTVHQDVKLGVAAAAPAFNQRGMLGLMEGVLVDEVGNEAEFGEVFRWWCVVHGQIIRVTAAQWGW